MPAECGGKHCRNSKKGKCSDCQQEAQLDPNGVCRACQTGRWWEDTETPFTIHDPKTCPELK